MEKEVDTRDMIKKNDNNMKLIQTKDYLLLIDEEAEIKFNDLFLGDDRDRLTESERWKICKNESTEGANYLMCEGVGYQEGYNPFLILAYYPLTNKAVEIDLPLLPNPFKDEVDVEKLACNIYNLSLDEYEYINEDLSQNRSLIEEHYKDINREEIAERYFDVISFIAGYNVAQPKQFTLEDMCSFAKYVRDYYYNIHKPVVPTEELLNNFIQSLSTQQFPKEFIISDKFSTFEENIKHGVYKW